jgi:hypothetical protein
MVDPPRGPVSGSNHARAVASADATGRRPREETTGWLSNPGDRMPINGQPLSCSHEETWTSTASSGYEADGMGAFTAASTICFASAACRIPAAVSASAARVTAVTYASCVG